MGFFRLWGFCLHEMLRYFIIPKNKFSFIGAHRFIGVTYTRIKSASLDGWTNAMFQIMDSIGNETANQYWEYNTPQNRPDQNSTQEAINNFVYDKYVKAKYANPNEINPVKQLFEAIPK